MSNGQFAFFGTSNVGPPALTSELRMELWSMILERLNAGDVLITQLDFQTALEEGYAALAGRKETCMLIPGRSRPSTSRIRLEPTEDTRQSLARMVTAVNDAHPDKFLGQGLQNGVNKAFETGVRRLKWDLAKIQTHGVSALRAFRRRDEVRNMLDEINVRAMEIDLVSCVKRTITVIEEQQGTDSRSAAESAPPALPLPPPRRATPPPPPKPSAPPPPKLRPEFKMAVEKGDVSQTDAERRILQQERQREKLQNAEVERVPENLPSYVSRGLLSKDEATAVQDLHQVDVREKKREINHGEADQQRDGILLPEARDQLDKKVLKATEETIKYLEVFEAMKKIHTQYDEALLLLIQHKRMVVAEEDSDDRSPLVRTLIDDHALLGTMVDIMGRKDPEIRLLDVRLPPYNSISNRGLETIENLTIEEDFIHDLRNMTIDEMSDRLNSVDTTERIRPAADMRCFINLVDHVIKRTRFRRKLRMLRVARALEEYNESIQEIYRSTDNVENAKAQAEQFLNRRVKKLFTDTSPDEVKEIQQRTAATLAAAELAVQGAHTNDVDSLLGPEPAPAAEEPADDLNLSDDEVKKGIQIGRVEMRIAGKTKKVPQKIMPDPDDPEKFCIAQRNTDTGLLAPAKRRGSIRYVIRGRDGWKIE